MKQIHFMDKVKITGGFYKGVTGLVFSKFGLWSYHIRFDIPWHNENCSEFINSWNLEVVK